MSQISTEKTTKGQEPLAATKATTSADPNASQDELRSLQGTPPTDGVIIKADGSLESSNYEEGSAQTTMVTLTGNVYEEFFFPNTTRPSYRLLYHAGQIVPKSTIEAFNEATKRSVAMRENGGVDKENPAGIDSTTIASGTKVKADQ